VRRRELLHGSLGLGAGVALGGLSGCGPTGTEPQAPVTFEPGQPLPWINWAGNQSCLPNWRFAPVSEDQLVDVMKSARGVVRAVGGSHSFSPVVPTDDTLVATDLLNGMVSHDAAQVQATFLAGTRLNAMGPMLDAVGQALPNMPDMDYPSLGGSIANSVHATGTEFGSMSAYVTAMTLASPAGELIDCSAKRNREIFQAARTSVGALGIVSRITLQNQPAFDLTEVNQVENMEDVFDDMETRIRDHRHFECFPIPYSSQCITVATDIAKPGDGNVGEDDPNAINTLRALADSTAWIPGVGDAVYGTILDAVLKGEAATVRSGPSYRVFPHVRVVRFREMEYTVPAEAGPECVREILRTIRARNLPLYFPLEYRCVKADDVWLSMFEGRDGCSISVHQFGDLDYRAPFAEIEPIFWKYAGRPHWGKLHTLDADRLAQLYPRHWQDFQEVRRALDPQGRLLNPHLRKLFGV
jgi:FAD-linked oxidoreductase